MIDNTNRPSVRASNFRRAKENPHNPQCPLHLRRVCGVCTHFDGPLKSEEKRACTALQITTRAARTAKDCRRFERKTHGAG